MPEYAIGFVFLTLCVGFLFVCASFCYCAIFNNITEGLSKATEVRFEDDCFDESGHEDQ